MGQSQEWNGMTNYKVQENGKKHTAEIIEAESSRDAKKAYRTKNELDIKLSGLETRVILAHITKERADEIYEKRIRKAGWTE